MKKTIPIPASHCDAFRKATFRTSFSLNLSQPMIEMLCAVADGVMWDRSLYHSSSPIPDNWIASQQALEKRGLVRPATDAEREKDRKHYFDPERFYEWNNWRLTPIGLCVVNMLKAGGIFVEADAAINKRTRKA